MSGKPARTVKSKAATMPAGQQSIRADEVLLLREAARRLGWKEHAVRQAKRRGLRVIVFGRQKYVLGEDVLGFFRRLAENGAGTPGREE